MIVSTRGIVLHSIKYGETSLICRIYTAEFGLVSYMVNGVRSAKSKSKAVLLQSGNILDMQVYNRDNKNLQHIKEFKLAFIYNQISRNIVKTSVCLFALELLNNAIKEEEKNPYLYHFIESSLCYLDETSCEDAAYPVWFMIQLSKIIGYEPGNHFDAESATSFSLKEGLFHQQLKDEYSIEMPYSLYWQSILDQDMPKNIYASNSERKKMLDYVQTYYQHHIENFRALKSPAILHEVLS